MGTPTSQIRMLVDWFVTMLEPGITDDNQLTTTTDAQEKNVQVILDGNIGAAGTTWEGLIDVSDTDFWPHDLSAGVVIVSDISFQADKLSATKGSVAVGVITRVDGTDADIEIIDQLCFINSGSTFSGLKSAYTPTKLKCDPLGGTLQSVLTNSRVSAVTAINTAGGDLNFGGLKAFVPAVGDVVIRIVVSGGAPNLQYNCSVSYRVE